MCARIVQYNDNLDDKDTKLLHKGFTFDILAKGKDITDKVEEVQLVELNSFGPNSCCGSALFHWVKDWSILRGAEEAEMRILASPETHDP